MRKPLALLLVLAACTSAPVATPTPTPSASRTAAPIQTRAPAFRAARAMTHVREIASLGPRETTSRVYQRAATYVADTLGRYGYDVRRDGFDVPAGTVDDVEVGGGRTFNVVALPEGFDPHAPHVLVGGHLDTVPDSPGANDNASGIAVLLELARLAARAPARLPIVFVAFGAEERRGPSDETGILYGSRAYATSLSGARPRDVVGFLNLDMVGAGDRVIVIGSGRLFRLVLRRGRALEIASQPGSASGLYSDHRSFEARDIEVAWLWAGEHDSLHDPTDVAGVVQRAQLRRVGRLAWDALRRFRG